MDTESNPDAAPTSAALLTPPNAVVPFLPLLMVVAVNFACTLFIFPALNWDYLNEEKFGGVTLSARAGIWAVTVGLTAAVVVTGCTDRAPRATQTQDEITGSASSISMSHSSPLRG